MKLAVISDVHADARALEAVLAYAGAECVDAWLCLGDVVGYGDQPQECVNLLRSRRVPTLRGNHDAWAARPFDPLRLSSVPGLDLARRELTDDARRWLRELPLVLQPRGVTAVHASLYEPEAWHRLTTAEAAKACFDRLHTPICFFGHTHEPGYWDSATLTWHPAISGPQLRIEAAGMRYLVNPGAVRPSPPSNDGPRGGPMLAIYESTLQRIEWVRCGSPE